MPSTTSSWEQPGNRLGSALYVVVIVALSLIAATATVQPKLPASLPKPFTVQGA